MPEREIIGLVPMAGRGERLGRLPCSKEIFPVAMREAAGVGARPRAVCEGLLESFAAAGIRRAFVVLREGKWDIPTYLAGGEPFGVELAYLVLRESASVPASLDKAYRFLERARVALGFPDALVEPADVFTPLIERQARSRADIVLGLFPTDRPDKADMVELDGAGGVVDIIIKQPRSGLRFMWGVALWTPRFTRFLHECVASAPEFAAGRELYVGDVLRAALKAGFPIATVAFESGSFRDVGTPEDLARSVSFRPLAGG